MDKFHQELFDVLTKSRNTSNRGSKAASAILEGKGEDKITLTKNELHNMINKILSSGSKAASASVTDPSNQVQVIHNFLSK
jgi:hypothetical protein